jgi:hypothetical protein
MLRFLNPYLSFEYFLSIENDTFSWQVVDLRMPHGNLV